MAQFQTVLVSRTGFLEPFLRNNQDSVMADREFTIYDELKELCVALDIQGFIFGVANGKFRWGPS